MVLKTKLCIGGEVICEDAREYSPQAHRIEYPDFRTNIGTFDVFYLRNGFNTFELCGIIPRYRNERLAEEYKSFLPAYIKKLQSFLKELENA